jgi:hypothetical protein
MSDISLLINKAVADNVSALVTDAAQASLMRSRHVLSGEDSGLNTTWEEICVQVQGERGIFWESYEYAMRDAVLGALQFIDRSALKSLWLYTDEGCDLRYELEEDEETGRASQADYAPPDISVDEEAIAHDIVSNHLLQIAVDYRNSRIEVYLCPGHDDLCDDDDEVDNDSTEHSDENPSQLTKVREIEYYDDTWDSSNYLVCFDRYYIFAIRPKDAEPKWEYLHPDGARWDAVHQRVYRNFRADRINRDQLPADLPPPPDSITPEQLLPLPPLPPEIFLRSDYPNLDKRLQESDGAMPLYLILMEDRYESLHGDGKFHYPETLFFGEGEALTFKASSDDSYTYYIRAGLIWLDGDNIECKMPRRTFDHFSYGEVMRLAEPKLNTLEKGSQ